MKRLILIFLLINLFISCDILRFSRFEIISWTPGEGIFSEPDNVTISLRFSNEPNRASVERNFSLTGNGNRVRGAFNWEGKKIIFTPLAPLEFNMDYIINLSSDACDLNGLSMDEDFNCNFTTRLESLRPYLISCFPPMYAEINDRRSEVKFEFSLPVTFKTLYDNISFSPSMTGLWRLENDNKLAVFTPSEPWARNTRYEIRLSTSLTNTDGMSVGKDFISIFTTRTDSIPPVLLYANRVTKKDEIIHLNPDNSSSNDGESYQENQDWEKDDKLQLIFSEPVDSVTVKNYLNIEDSQSLFMETSPGYKSEFIFRFDNIPVFESRFTLRIKPGVKDIDGNESKEEYVYKIFANGKYSKPPSLAGFRMPIAVNKENELTLEYFSINSLYEIISISDNYYPSGESVAAWIELYFDTAEGALIDPFSIMEHFRIETSNNVINFSPRQVKIKDFTVSDPQQGMEKFQRAEIKGILINSTDFGIINFLIAPGLRDSLGNKNENLLRISVIK